MTNSTMLLMELAEMDDKQLAGFFHNIEEGALAGELVCRDCIMRGEDGGCTLLDADEEHGGGNPCPTFESWLGWESTREQLITEEDVKYEQSATDR